jgi:hypothetical protein
VVLDEGDDHYLIGPEGTELVEGEDAPGDVRAWPKANWEIANGEGGDDA